jgi:hypothetical protein
MARIRRWVWKTARTVHLYVTLFGVALLTFFAVTGFMLNHEHWFIDPNKEPRAIEGTVPAEMLDPVNVLAIENLLRRDYAVAGHLEPVDVQDNPLEFRFLRPGRRVEARITRDDEPPPDDDMSNGDEKMRPSEKKPGKLKVVYYDDGAAGIMVDLHKGKSTGRAWKLVIDAVCILIVIVAMTGLVLWSSLRGHNRFIAVAMFAVGIGSGLGVYFLFVP